MQPVDEYALMEWLESMALDAHLEVQREKDARETIPHNTPERILKTCEIKMCEQRESDFNEVITHIQNGRVNQRPHVKERI